MSKLMKCCILVTSGGTVDNETIVTNMFFWEKPTTEYKSVNISWVSAGYYDAIIPQNFQHVISSKEEKKRDTPEEFDKRLPCHVCLYHTPDCPCPSHVFKDIGLKRTRNYSLEIYTGDKRLAASDATAYITLYGALGKTSEIVVNGPFRNSTTTEHRFEQRYLGPLDRLTVRHDNSGIGAGWYIDKIKVTMDMGSIVLFPCNRWLARSEDDGQVERTLYCCNVDNVKPVDYLVSITTGSVFGAGSDAKAYVVLFGDRGHTCEHALQPKKGFDRGSVRECVLQSPDVGALQKLLIRHDNSKAAAGWYIDKIVVAIKGSEKKWEFPCQQWLAKDEGDNKISRELRVSKP